MRISHHSSKTSLLVIRTGLDISVGEKEKKNIRVNLEEFKILFYYFSKQRKPWLFIHI